MRNGLLGFVVAALVLLVGARAGAIPGLASEQSVRAISRGQLIAAEVRTALVTHADGYVTPDEWQEFVQQFNREIVDEGELVFRCFLTERFPMETRWGLPAFRDYRIHREHVLVVYAFESKADAQRLVGLNDTKTDFSIRKDAYVLARRFDSSRGYWD